MSAEIEITEVVHFMSLTTIVRTLNEDCQTDEDAAALIADGLVKVNDQPVTDTFYALCNGRTVIDVAGREFKCIITKSGKHTKKLLHRANLPATLKRLREGRVVTVHIKSPNHVGWHYRLMLEPPKFDGAKVMACYYGYTSSQGRLSPLIVDLASGVTECGARVAGH